MTEFLAGVQRRIRLAWAVATGQPGALVVALVALVLVGIGWLRPVGWVEPAAVAVVVLAAAGMALATFALRVSEPIAARVADRGLATNDTFSTALEVGERHDPLAKSVLDRADALAREATVREAVPIRWRPVSLAAAAVIAATALGLALVESPQDEARRQQGLEQAALAEEAAVLASAADELRSPEASQDQLALADELDALAADLVSATDLEEGLSRLETAQAELAGTLSSDLLSQKAAARGLDRSLESTPLPGSDAGNAAAQLASVAAGLDALSDEELSELQERIEGLADTQGQGNQAAADALDDAASALANGDLSRASAALGEAAAAQSGSQQSIGDQQSRADAASALGQSTRRLEDGQTASESQPGAAGSSGAGNRDQGGGGSQTEQDTGESQAGAAGSSGSGDGDQGQGGGQDGGGGQGGQGGSGGSGGSANADPAGGGVGGAGQPAGDGQSSAAAPSDQEETRVFAPQDSLGTGQRLDAGSTGEGGEGETVGRVDGASGSGTALVPLSNALPRYQDQATAALESADIPPSQTALVREYFDNLSQR